MSLNVIDDSRTKVLDMVKDLRAAGSSLASACRQVGISENKYYYWVAHPIPKVPGKKRTTLMLSDLPLAKSGKTSKMLSLKRLPTKQHDIMELIQAVRVIDKWMK